MTDPRRRAVTRWAIPIVVAAGALAGQVAWLLQPAASQELTEQEAVGRSLYVANCSSCHGLDANGTQDGPSLQGDGPASVDFMLSTGRMPLNQPTQQPVRQEPRYSPEEIAAIVSYVATIAPAGPAIPAVDPDAGDLQLGFALYTGVCSACHGAGATGDSIGGGQIAPPLGPSTPLQIGEAIRVGPGAMPRFGEETYDDHDVNSMIRYLEYLDAAPDPGGLGIGRYGPVAEGFVVVFFAFGVLLIVIRLTGTKT
jgi:ubiquinol-cytochrome c reductase cytochrome c subunit